MKQNVVMMNKIVSRVCLFFQTEEKVNAFLLDVNVNFTGLYLFNLSRVFFMEPIIISNTNKIAEVDQMISTLGKYKLVALYTLRYIIIIKYLNFIVLYIIFFQENYLSSLHCWWYYWKWNNKYNFEWWIQ